MHGLNRVITWINEGIQYKADPRQRDKLVEELGLEKVHAVATPLSGRRRQM